MERILEIITSETNLHRGITLPQLASKSGQDVNTTKVIVNGLYLAGKIRTRNGINHTLIYPMTWKK